MQKAVTKLLPHEFIIFSKHSSVDLFFAPSADPEYRSTFLAELSCEELCFEFYQRSSRLRDVDCEAAFFSRH